MHSNFSSKIILISELIQRLTLLEINTLIQNLEQNFNLSSNSNFSLASPVSTIPVESILEEKTTFEVHLTLVPVENKINILKQVRTITGLGLKESKEIIDNIPKLLKEGVSKEESEKIKADIEALGGKILIK